MKYFNIFTVFLLISYNSYAGSCSSGVLEDFKSEVKTSVYLAEGLELVKEFTGTKEVAIEAPYPSIKSVTDCLTAYENRAAYRSCSDVFTAATKFSEIVKKAGSSINPYIFSDMDKDGIIIPDAVINFYTKYEGVPLTGGYFGELSLAYAEAAKLAEARTDVVAVTGGFTDYFTKMLEISTKCNTNDGVPTYQDPKVKPESVDGYAIVDVYKNGAKTCSFIVSIDEKSEIRLKVPDLFKKCVKESDAVITNIEQKNDDSLLVSKKVAGLTSDFVSNVIDAPIKAIATEEKVEAVKALLDGLDMGVSGGNLSMAASVSISDINFDNISSLNPTILKIVALCEYGVSAENYASDFETKFLPEWNNIEGDTVSADDGKHGGYYRAMYFYQLQNSLNYPVLKKLHKEVKNGTISNADLISWSGKALAICSLNYPTYWNPAYIYDYIADEHLDDSSAIPSWDI